MKAIRRTLRRSPPVGYPGSTNTVKIESWSVIRRTAFGGMTSNTKRQPPILGNYDSSKIACGLLDRYAPLLEPWVAKSINLLEIGIDKGGSLLLWKDYFPRGKIVGIDAKLPKLAIHDERIRIFEGRQEDTEFLTAVSNKEAPDGFDIIIDDASHIGQLTKATFWHLFENHLKPGGLYAIEDWGCGYWDDWPDGRSFDPPHHYGMVGFIKELVDEIGAIDLSRGSLEGTPTRSSCFESVQVFPALAVVTKVTHRTDYPKTTTRRNVSMKQTVSISAINESQLAKITGWGPQSTTVGSPFNVQSTGNSAFWIEIGVAGDDLVVYLEDMELPTARSESTITASPNVSQLEKFVRKPGTYRLYLVSPPIKKKQEIGVFQVQEAVGD